MVFDGDDRVVILAECGIGRSTAMGTAFASFSTAVIAAAAAGVNVVALTQNDVVVSWVIRPQQQQQQPRRAPCVAHVAKRGPQMDI